MMIDRYTAECMAREKDASNYIPKWVSPVGPKCWETNDEFCAGLDYALRNEDIRLEGIRLEEELNKLKEKENQMKTISNNMTTISNNDMIKPAICEPKPETIKDILDENDSMIFEIHSAVALIETNLFAPNQMMPGSGKEKFEGGCDSLSDQIKRQHVMLRDIMDMVLHTKGSLC